MPTPEQDEYLKQFGIDVAQFRADAVSSGAVFTASPAHNGFEPNLEPPSVPKSTLDLNETVILKLKICNWNQAPKGIKLGWVESVTWGKGAGALDIEEADQQDDGERTVKVTGRAAGDGTVRAEVRIGEGDAVRSYRFADTRFEVRGKSADDLSADPFVADLDIPYTPRSVLGVGQSVPLKLRIRNWSILDTHASVDWGVRSDGNAVKLDMRPEANGEATVTVTAVGTGKSTVRPYVRIGIVQADVGSQRYYFAGTDFVVKDAVDPNSPDPDSSPDQGGVATVGDLENDMRTVLRDWGAAATRGVSEFATGALEQRMNELSSGSVLGFLQSVVGAVIWAAACFETGGAAFAISLAGITIGAIPSLPSTHDEKFVSQVQRAMDDHIDAIVKQQDSRLRSKAEALLKSEPGITRYHALALCVKASFQAKYVSIDATFTKIPQLNTSAMAETYRDQAEQALNKAIEADKERKLQEKRRKLGYPMPPEEA